MNQLVLRIGLNYNDKALVIGCDERGQVGYEVQCPILVDILDLKCVEQDVEALLAKLECPLIDEVLVL